MDEVLNYQMYCLKTNSEKQFLDGGMQYDKIQKMIGTVAAISLFFIMSISAFAASSYNHAYNLSAGETGGPILILADENYMYFYTHPSAGAGGVHLQVSGSGVNGVHKYFPYYGTTSALKIDTSSGIGNYYTAYLTADSTDVQGVLNIWTSAN